MLEERIKSLDLSKLVKIMLRIRLEKSGQFDGQELERFDRKIEFFFQQLIWKKREWKNSSKKNTSKSKRYRPTQFNPLIKDFECIIYFGFIHTPHQHSGDEIQHEQSRWKWVVSCKWYQKRYCEYECKSPYFVVDIGYLTK